MKGAKVDFASFIRSSTVFTLLFSKFYGHFMKAKRAILISGAILVIGFFLIAAASFRNTIKPTGIIIHHSAIPSPADSQPVDAEFIETIHKRKGYGIFYWGKTYYTGYHYLILPDGTLRKGRPETARGAHTSGMNDKIGICLIGEFTGGNPAGNQFEPAAPTPEQMATLTKITNELLSRHQLSSRDIYTHREFNPKTECPGDNFDFDEFLAELKK
jgi:N-acetylmuramoyl-L-alanine amidase